MPDKLTEGNLAAHDEKDARRKKSVRGDDARVSRWPTSKTQSEKATVGGRSKDKERKCETGRK